MDFNNYSGQLHYKTPAQEREMLMHENKVNIKKGAAEYFNSSAPELSEVWEETVSVNVQVSESLINRIRADAINDCINTIKRHWTMWNVGVIKAVIDRLEQLKEQNNERDI